jgi:hypothetical protein
VVNISFPKSNVEMKIKKMYPHDRLNNRNDSENRISRGLLSHAFAKLFITVHEGNELHDKIYFSKSSFDNPDCLRIE